MENVIIMPRVRTEQHFTIRIHKPMWGGFPKHWVKGPASQFTFTEESGEAEMYSDADAETIERQLYENYPGAVVARNAL